MRNKLILGLMVVAVIAIGAGLLLKTTANNATTQTQNQTNNNTQTTPRQKITSSYVSVTAAGFEPQSISIKKGTRVVWINKSGKDVSVNSDQHPTHTMWPFLNLGSFSNGSSVSVVFGKTGKYTYHNHYNPEQKGTIIVE